MIVDVNVTLSRWPCRRLPYDETPRLVEKLRPAGVSQAWVGSFDALLHKDMAAVNTRLISDCAQHADVLVPFGAVNPTLPAWQDDLMRCAQEQSMLGVRLYPNYHGYDLSDPVFAELIAIAEEQGLIVQLAVQLEDQRTQHRLLRVEPVDLSPLPALLKKHPRLRLVLLNAMRAAGDDKFGELMLAGNVCVEFAMLDGIGGLGRLMKQVPLDRILFGSHFPFYYHESAQLKLRESELARFQQEAITSGNALALRGTH